MPNIFVILDGAAGRTDEIDNKSCYEAASLPNLDYFAKQGKCGLSYTVGKGIAPESDVAVVSLLGYDAYKHFTGRGPLEAYGAGVNLPQDFVAFRTNFATVYGNTIVDRRVGRTLTTKESKKLEKVINSKVKLPCNFVYKSTVGHRGVLVLYGKLGSDLTNADPAYEIKGKFGVAKSKGKMELQDVKALNKKSQKTALIVNDFIRQSFKVLSNNKLNLERKSRKLLPANIILPRDAGNRLPKFSPKKSWAAIVSMPLEKGIAELCGMHVYSFKYPEYKSGNIYSYLEKGLKKTIKSSKFYLKKHWGKYDNFYVHFKETDIPGHDGNPQEKIKMLELIDKHFFSWLRKRSNFRLLVVSDHATPTTLRSHSSDPVPFLLYGNGKDKVSSFSEKACSKGSLGIKIGNSLIKLLN